MNQPEQNQLEALEQAIKARAEELAQETIDKANEEGIPILMWPESAFNLAGQVCSAGVVEVDP